MSTTIMMMRMKDSWTMIDVYTSFVSIADVVFIKRGPNAVFSYNRYIRYNHRKGKQIMELIGNLKKKVDKAST